jgi:hypothetical protein
MFFMEKFLKDNQGGLHLDVPLDYQGVVSPRPASYIYRHVEARLERDLPIMQQTIEHLRPFSYHDAFNAISRDQQSETEPYWANGYLSEGDGRSILGMTGYYKPKKIIEIGSGNSTKFFRKAINTFRLQTQLTSIDPMPRRQIDALCDTCLRYTVLDANPGLFAALEPGDILFHDGSHITFNGTDTVHLFLEILPVLKPGVIVHLHDILLPYEYHKDFDGRGYSEQYMLATALLSSSSYEVVLPLNFLSHRKLFLGGLSFWMKV